MQRRRHQVRQRRDVAAGHVTARCGDLRSLRYVGGQRRGELRGVIGEDEARRQQFHQVGELAVVPRNHRIGRRDRAERNPGMERAERDQRVIDRIAGEDHDRLLGRKVARQQRRGDVPR